MAAAVRVLRLLGAALFVLDSVVCSSGSSGGDSTVTYTVNLGSGGACLRDINDVREKAGFSKFVQASDPGKQLPSPENTDKKWDGFCRDVLRAGSKGSKTRLSADDDESAMYGMMVVGSSKVDCGSILDRWKDAYKGFSGPPPSPDQSSGLYENPEAVMFVAFFNASSGATADCRVVTCTETSTPVAPTEKQGKAGREGYAFLCVITPNVLGDKGTPPFTKQQWEKIASIFKGSAPAAVPSVLFVVLAALGGALF